MSPVVKMLVFLLILGSAVLIHELGHFLVARRLGVGIEEFGIGLPPRLHTIGRWRGTAFTLNWIPIGGFVRPRGEFDRAEPAGLAAAPPARRSAVLLAGALSNLLFAFALLAGAYMLGGPVEGQVRVVGVAAGSPAAVGGLQAGDLIVGLDGDPVGSATELRASVEAHAGRALSLAVLREGSRRSIRLVPRSTWPPGQGPAGFYTQVEIERYRLLEAGRTSAGQVWSMLRATGVTLARAAAGGGGEFRVVGPVGLKQASDWTLDQAAQWDAPYPVLYLAALIHVGVGFTNLLPLPALDGGRLAFVLVEVGARRRVPPRVERLVHGAGAAGLVLVTLVLSALDAFNPLI